MWCYPKLGVESWLQLGGGWIRRQLLFKEPWETIPSQPKRPSEVSPGLAPRSRAAQSLACSVRRLDVIPWWGDSFLGVLVIRALSFGVVYVGP